MKNTRNTFFRRQNVSSSMLEDILDFQNEDEIINFLNLEYELLLHKYRGNNTILHKVIEKDRLKLVQYLLDRKMFIYDRNDANESPLFYSIKHGSNFQTFEMLLPFYDYKDVLFEQDIYGNNSMKYLLHIIERNLTSYNIKEKGIINLIKNVIKDNFDNINTEYIFVIAGKINEILHTNRKYIYADFFSEEEKKKLSSNLDFLMQFNEYMTDIMLKKIANGYSAVII